MNNLTLLLLFMIVALEGCSHSNDNESKAYSFFVAGHVYGYPGETETNIGVHPPFKQKLEMIKNNPDIKFGVFTGDIVFDALKENEWDEVDQDIAFINKKVYFAPGNHDVGSAKKRDIFTRRYGPTYQSFVYAEDLVIILDPNLKGWSIEGDQLTWLKEQLNPNKNTVRNIFVFFHQLLWWTPENEFKSYPPNSTSGGEGNNNFFTEVYPLFRDFGKPTYMFAGDTGVYERGIFYHKDKNFTFIASGMGGRKQDNFVIANVDPKGLVSFQLVSLNTNDSNELGKLENYTLND
ncbi:Calcineurin-like phosphoesterase [Flagellimonas taeanensis]|uniref:Calcineurin-like phosphoesterase n=1 Tax=Flagellimonas taeanensis TaxID=1005926 RepID=A0A1M6QDF3_9FLAO|nr:metallophosphoesterase [Allomuricauda taeanensis]SFB70264.1 Calcineurin-like phosphoesterase [Allomuricauda taeanensis]SHK18093.1 Calcineurin-like phosphoesterase [Allomuricauda taeanensis]